MDGALDTAGLVAALRDDPRVHGIVRLASPDERTHLLIATTWDGREPLAARLPELAAHVVGATDAEAVRDDEEIDLLTAGDVRVRISVARLSDLKPSAQGEGGVPLLDPQGTLAQWVAWSAGRPRRAADEPDLRTHSRRRLLGADDALRALAALPPGAALVRPGGPPAPLRHALGERLRHELAALPEGPVTDALRARAEATLASVPRAGAGLRESGPGARERFLAVADGEGFAGDRVLLDAAETHVREVTGRAPVFEAGFALPTFDRVEALYALGEAVGGCKPPLVPGLLVGVAVTPADDLAFWAAPTVREPLNDRACVADDGDRAVLPRGAGRDALVGALTSAIDGALDELPVLLRRARAAHREQPEDRTALLRTLHLPATHARAAELHGATAPGTSRLTMALALCRAAADMEPVVAAKLEWAAGRLLRATPPATDDDCADTTCTAD